MKWRGRCLLYHISHLSRGVSWRWVSRHVKIIITETNQKKKDKLAFYLCLWCLCGKNFSNVCVFCYLSVSRATKGFSSGLWSKEEYPLLGTTNLCGGNREREKEWSEEQKMAVTEYDRKGGRKRWRRENGLTNRKRWVRLAEMLKEKEGGPGGSITTELQ